MSSENTKLTKDMRSYHKIYRINKKAQVEELIRKNESIENQIPVFQQQLKNLKEDMFLLLSSDEMHRRDKRLLEENEVIKQEIKRLHTHTSRIKIYCSEMVSRESLSNYKFEETIDYCFDKLLQLHFNSSFIKSLDLDEQLFHHSRLENKLIYDRFSKQVELSPLSQFDLTKSEFSMKFSDTLEERIVRLDVKNIPASKADLSQFFKEANKPTWLEKVLRAGSQGSNNIPWVKKWTEAEPFENSSFGMSEDKCYFIAANRPHSLNTEKDVELMFYTSVTQKSTNFKCAPIYIGTILSDGNLHNHTDFTIIYNFVGIAKGINHHLPSPALLVSKAEVFIQCGMFHQAE